MVSACYAEDIQTVWINIIFGLRNHCLPEL